MFSIILHLKSSTSRHRTKLFRADWTVSAGFLGQNPTLRRLLLRTGARFLEDVTFFRTVSRRRRAVPSPPDKSISLTSHYVNLCLILTFRLSFNLLWFGGHFLRSQRGIATNFGRKVVKSNPMVCNGLRSHRGRWGNRFLVFCGLIGYEATSHWVQRCQNGASEVVIFYRLGLSFLPGCQVVCGHP
jgi:hypothetical protein